MASYVENDYNRYHTANAKQKENQMSLRADGRENRLRLIETAEAVFSDQGFGAPLDVIAKQAGVSRMTLYRHFKDRETLCFAICDRNVRMLEEKAEALKENPNAFTEILGMMLERFATNQAMMEGLTRQQTHQEQINSLMQRVVALLTEPLVRAQAAGFVKNTLRPEDLSILIYMLGGAVGEGSTEAKTARVRRAMAILESGFLCAGDDGQGWRNQGDGNR